MGNELTPEQQLAEAQQKIAIAAEKELKEVADYVNTYLKERGYTMAARTIIESGKLPYSQCFIAKSQKQS